MANKNPNTHQALFHSISEKLESHPALAERFYSILQIADEPGRNGKFRKADEVEAMLIEEVRKLGNEVLMDWAEGVDTQLGEQLKDEDSTVQMREKKTSNGGADLD